MSGKRWKSSRDRMRQKRTSLPGRMKTILSNIRCMCKKKGLPFNLTFEDLLPLPDACPVLGLPFDLGFTGKKGFKDYSPSVDRVVGKLGYVRGNVRVISMKANRIRSNASWQKIQAVANYSKELDSHV